MKLKDDVTDKVRELLGGKNPTQRRVDSLLEELKSLRAQEGEVTVAVEEPVGTGEPGPGFEIQEKHVTTDVVIPLNGPLPTPEVQTAVTPGDGKPADWETERTLMYANMEQMAKKLAELEKRTTEKDRDEAIGSGKLPVGNNPAPPLGYTGLGDIPRGKWMLSPFGPKVNFIICGCNKCSVVRLHHWYCSICKSGPFPYQGRYPHFSRTVLAPASGGTWGLNHHCCSEPCRIGYLAALGVTPGLNDHGPPQVTPMEGEAPSRPIVAHDSD